MKKIFALTILAASFSAFAVGPIVSIPAVNSYSEVSIGSQSAFGTNQGSFHFSAASAQNTTTASGSATSGWLGAAAATTATTTGKTFTTAGGVGSGMAGAGADQYGKALVTASPGPKLVVSSEVGVHTGSAASVTHTGLAVSGSIGGATNTSAGIGSFGYTKVGSVGADGGMGGGFEIGNGSYSTGGGTYQMGNGKVGTITPFTQPSPQ